MYRIYEIASRSARASEYRRGLYDNEIDYFRQIQHHVKKLFPCIRYINELPFLMLWNSKEDTPKTLLCRMTHI